MKTQILQLLKSLGLAVVITATGSGFAFGQGNNWKITGNSNINENVNFLGTTNAKDLNLGTNNTKRMTIGKNGGVNVTGHLIADSIWSKGPLKVGEESFVFWNNFHPSVPGCNTDMVFSTQGEIGMARFSGLDFSGVHLGIGLCDPVHKLHLFNGPLFTGGPFTDRPVRMAFTNQTTGKGVNDGFQIGIDLNEIAQINQKENLPMSFFTFDTERMEILAGGNVGVGNTAVFDAQSLLHLDRGDNIAFSQYTTGTTGNTTAADGLRIGVAANGNAEIRQHEDLPLDIFTNDAVLHTRKMRIFHDAVTNQPRVSIGLSANPLTHLHIGLDAFPNTGFRPWMNVGVLMYTSPTGFDPILGTDNMYVGMQRVTADRADAIINWGNNPITTVGPDRLRFVFTAAAGNGQASLLPGLEISRMIAFPNSIGFTGFGGDPNVPNLYSTGSPDPQNTVEINSPAIVIGPNNSGLRFTDLNSTSATIANPGLGVLSVDGNGDVIYVPDAPAGGVGDCLNPTLLTGNGGAIDMNNVANFHFLGNGFGAGVNNVIIGATPTCVIPDAKLHVEQSSTDNSTIGILVHNTDEGHVTDWCNSAIGIQSVVDTDTTFNRRIAGWFEAPPQNAADKSLAIFVPEAGGQVSIGYSCSNVTPAGYLLEVNSSAWSAGTWIDGSDQAWKQNIDTINDPLEKINSIKGVYYHWDTLGYPEYNFPSDRQVGFVAQNVDTVLPEVVHGDNGSMGIAYGRMTPLLLEAVKQLNKKVEYLEDLVGECCEENVFKTTEGNQGGETNDPIYEKLASKGVILYDAVPNPFQGEVSIGFFIPERIINAEIVFYDNYGRTLKTIAVNQRGNGIVIIDASDLASGLYTYGIVADGQAIDTKKMIRSK